MEVLQTPSFTQLTLQGDVATAEYARPTVLAWPGKQARLRQTSLDEVESKRLRTGELALGSAAQDVLGGDGHPRVVQ